eukprot:TRINITY_DN100792_c0_g1_i1.p1 TRINITY_DN100792_c0_g1~~TRINITY_DN100792_c0_g1_i1.p1  ORF type:complete len:303 (+),score=89.95 TRINITY_DN100792_c0_g1_i1:124-909(+)
MAFLVVPATEGAVKNGLPYPPTAQNGAPPRIMRPSPRGGAVSGQRILGVSAILATMAVAGQRRVKQRKASKAKLSLVARRAEPECAEDEESDAEEEIDSLLLQAGLRNLGSEAKMVIKKLEEVCEVAEDREECVGAVKEMCMARARLQILESQNESMQAENEELESKVDELTLELCKAKSAMQTLQEKAADHWKRQKAVEASRDKALIAMEKCKDEAAHIKMSAEAALKVTKAQLSAAQRELEALRADVKTKKTSAHPYGV